MFARFALLAIFFWTLGGTALTTFAQTSGTRYAILAGVEEYEHSKLQTLQYAEDDVLELNDLLTRAGYKVSLLCDALGEKNSALLPTKANLETTIKSVLEKLKRNDTILVCLTGHGLNFTGQADSFFCPRDAKPLFDRTDTLVSLTSLYKQLDDCGAGIKVLLVDACRNDPDPGRGRGSGIDADTAPRPPQGVAVLYSCSNGERAYEHDKFKHGVFTHFILRGLEGAARDTDNEITFETLAGYVKKQTARTVPQIMPGRQQSPNLKADLSGTPAILIDHAALERLQSTKKAQPLEFVRIKGGTLKHTTFEKDMTYPDFDMGKYEVTVGQFREFVSATGYKTIAELVADKELNTANELIQKAYSPKLFTFAKVTDNHMPRGYGWNKTTRKMEYSTQFSWKNLGFAQEDDHPVLNVTYTDMLSFCQWRSKQDGALIRLPYDLEFELATANESNNYGARLQAWVNEAKPEVLATSGAALVVDNSPEQAASKTYSTTSVTKGDVSKLGIHGLFSNQIELWDIQSNGEYVPYHAPEGMSPLPETPGFYGFRVVREIK